MWPRSQRATGDAEGGRCGGGGVDSNDLRSNAGAGADAAAAALDLDKEEGQGASDASADLDPALLLRRRRQLMRKLYLRTVPIACLITCATFIDRANLALAAPVLLHDIGLSRAQFGFSSAVMFLSYGASMVPSSLMFTVVSLRMWFGVIVSAWGAVTALTAVVGIAGFSPSTSFALLVALRLALGAAEAGTMPGCFFLLSRFLPKRELAYAYSWVLIFTVLAQVIGAPLGAAFIGPAEGFLGMHGWQVMFIVEGAMTVLVGLSIPLVVSDSVEEAPWLSAEEKAWVLAAREEEEKEEEEMEEKEAREEDEGAEKRRSAGGEGRAAAAAASTATKGDAASPPPPDQNQKQSVLAAAAEAMQVARSPQMWTLGIAILLVQTAFFAVTFFAPLLISDSFSKEALASAANARGGRAAAAPKTYPGPKAAADAAMHAAFKSTAVYAPSALTLVLAGALCRKTGDRKYQTFFLLLASAVGFAMVPLAVAQGSSRGALFSLIVGSCGGVGALAALTTWPERYCYGRHRCAEYAFWNSFVAVGGFGGPYLMGATSLKTSMSIMAGFQALAGCILLAFGVVEERGDRRRRRRWRKLERGEVGGSGVGGVSGPRRSYSGGGVSVI